MGQSTEDLLALVLEELRDVRGRLAELEARTAPAGAPAAPDLVTAVPVGVAVPVDVVPSEAPVAPAADLSAGDGPGEPARRSRRAVLGAAAAAAGAAVVGTLATSEPAAATTGNFLYGLTSDAQGDFTKLRSSNGTVTLAVENYGSGVALNPTAGSNHAISAASSGGSVLAGSTTSGIGVNVSSSSNTGVQAISGSGVGLAASSDSSTGATAASNTGSGLIATSGVISGVARTRSAVVADTSSGTAVAALTTSGTALQAAANGGGAGIVATSTTGTAVSATATNGTGMTAQSTVGSAFVANVTSQNATTAAVSGTVQGPGKGGLFTLGNAAANGVALKAVGDHAQLQLAPLTGIRNAPTGDSTAHERGELVIDNNGDLWLCVTAGTPGTWRKVGGPATAGQLHLFAAPIRVYDSRPGAAPTAVGPKLKLSPNVARPIDATLGATAVPAGATVALVNILIVNAPNASANFTIWASGVARPSANTMVWGGSATRFSTLAVTGLDAAGSFQVLSSVSCDVVLDVVGYHL